MSFLLAKVCEKDKITSPHSKPYNIRFLMRTGYLIFLQVYYILYNKPARVKCFLKLKFSSFPTPTIVYFNV